MLEGIGVKLMGVLVEDDVLGSIIRHKPKYSSTSINKETNRVSITSNISLFCNTLNAKEGHYRGLENKTAEDRDMVYILHEAQEKIVMLWNALIECGKITTCSNCGFEYYNEHIHTCIKCGHYTEKED